MKVADQLAKDVYHYGYAKAVVIDTPDYFHVERIPPEMAFVLETMWY